MHNNNRQEPQGQKCSSRLGIVTLKKGIGIDYIKNKYKYLASFCQNRQWSFEDSTYEELKINQVLNSCQQIRITTLQVHYIRNKSVISNMIRQMSNCVFPQLTTLNLMMSQLDSVQLLQLTRFQNLRSLSLTWHHITNLKSLRKLYIPNVSIIQLFSNRGNQLSSLVQLQNSTITELLLEDVGFPAQQYDQSWLFKIKSLKIRRLYLKSFTRVLTKPKSRFDMAKKFIHLIEYH